MTFFWELGCPFATYPFKIHSSVSKYSTLMVLHQQSKSVRRLTIGNNEEEALGIPDDKQGSS
ncbi:hypothetical protein L208DRAFT_1403806 [Tricholoma matsutake]|nr:hypothetical protein L208DRAFT_1403806 [Tricholoma matsutake 945]